MAADDVASAVARIATNPPVNGTIEIGGPEQFRLDELARRFLAARQDPREVISDPHGRYYGIEVSERALIPDNERATRRDPIRNLVDTVRSTNCECASSASASQRRPRSRRVIKERADIAALAAGERVSEAVSHLSRNDSDLAGAS